MTKSQNDQREKIAKLLAKAEGTDSPAEAEAFTRAAERLMIKWGIEEAVVRAAMTGEQPEEITTARILYTDTYSDAFVAFTSSIVDGLGELRTFYVSGHAHPDHRVVYVVGHRSDVQRAEMLISSLRLQAVSAMKTWWRTGRYSTHLKGWRAFKARRQFIISFGHGVGERLAGVRTETIAETGGASTELVLVDRATRVNAWVDEHIGELQKTRGLQSSLLGFAAGREAGRRADIGNNVTDGDTESIES
ncbi:DUF2786 domain-containing protein [Nocardiopsis sp. NPDC049922]|uniref:DUF2786 domain-containing protein n=1 Tax=Nocardiopsis sp. NPDC049922 TaxID=3155157 RepID=UPI00340B90D1